jgi:drug/metabolite transporter (DMT)-like permease
VAARLFGLFFPQITYVRGAQRTLAANAGIITLSIPVLAAICSSITLNGRQ